MKRSGKILLVEDDPSTAASLVRLLAEEGFVVAHETRGDVAARRAASEPFDAVLSDLRLPGMDGLALVRELRDRTPRLPVIVMTAHGTTETAIDAMRFGAFDYLLKDFEIPDLLMLLDRAVESHRAMLQPVVLGTPGSGVATDALVGRSRKMQEVYKAIGRVSEKPVDVLILGETGTGKDLAARAIYQHSLRRDHPFVHVNCAALPETLIESELFGHEPGAFTGAQTRRIGRFEQAHRGTLFLDEIGDMSAPAQTRLLHALQNRKIQRLGSNKDIAVDVRVIAATHRNLQREIAENRFREDLYYRLNVAVISLPPLRERREDIRELIEFFIRKHGADLRAPDAAFSEKALLCLEGHHWPGNVRELENTARNAILQWRGFPLAAEVIEPLLGRTQTQDALDPAMKASIAALVAAARDEGSGQVISAFFDRCEREIYAQSIELAGGNQAKAARWLGVSRLTMQTKLTAFGLHPKQQ